MTDSELVGKYLGRDESAIGGTKSQYGRYLLKIITNILGSGADAEECLDDVLLAAWNSIPPNEPENFQTYLGRLARNAAISRARRLATEKRGGGQLEAVLEELSDAAASEEPLKDIEDTLALKAAFNSFLRSLPDEQRRIFLRRYWYMQKITEIAEEMGLSVNKVKVTLFRTRDKLKKLLESEGFDI